MAEGDKLGNRGVSPHIKIPQRRIIRTHESDEALSCFHSFKYSRGICAYKYNKEYIQFVRIAFGSGAELETQIEITKKLKFAQDKDIQRVEDLLTEIMKMLNKFIYSLTAKP